MVFFSKYSLAVFLLLIGNVISVSGQIKLPTSKHQFVVIAHRGDHTEVPENTIESYKRAIKHSVDYIEIDLRTTKDSQLVIMHDESLLRMTGINAKVSALTYDSISKLSVRDALHPERGEYKVPTFREVLQLCKGKINIYLDFKNASVAQAYKEIPKTTRTNANAVILFRIDSEEEMATIYSEYPMGMKWHQWEKVVTHYTKEPYSFIMFNLQTSNPDYRVISNFNQPIAQSVLESFKMSSPPPSTEPVPDKKPTFQ
jgi:glycerophosphoryl diester phosphodiesterase